MKIALTIIASLGAVLSLQADQYMYRGNPQDSQPYFSNNPNFNQGNPNNPQGGFYSDRDNAQRGGDSDRDNLPSDRNMYRGGRGASYEVDVRQNGQGFEGNRGGAGYYQGPIRNINTRADLQDGADQDFRSDYSADQRGFYRGSRDQRDDGDRSYRDESSSRSDFQRDSERGQLSDSYDQRTSQGAYRGGRDQGYQDGSQSSYQRGSSYNETNKGDTRDNASRGSYKRGTETKEQSDRKIMSDDDLQKKVDDSLKNSWFSKNFDNVNADVQDGSVTLSGSVDSLQEKNDAEKRIRDINGIRNVNNQLTVSPKAMSKDSKDPRKEQKEFAKEQKKFPQDKAASAVDEDLNKNIRDKVTDKKVRLLTSQGNVIIEGTVKDKDDEKDILNDIKKISGVRNVQSRLQFNKDDTKDNR